MKLDFSMAKAGDKYIGELEFQRPDGEYDVWTIVKRLDPAVTGSRPKGYPIYLIGTATNSGLLSDYYYTPERGESESKSLEEINADLEVLAQDGESYMSRVKRVPKKGLKKNPPFYAHNLYEKKTHGLNLRQMRRLYAMVSRGNQKAITFARNVLGIPFSESPSQVKAVVLHHVRDLAERRGLKRNAPWSKVRNAFAKAGFQFHAYGKVDDPATGKKLYDYYKGDSLTEGQKKIIQSLIPEVEFGGSQSQYAPEIRRPVVMFPVKKGLRRNPARSHRERIAIDTVRHPMKGYFLGGPDLAESVRYLRSLGYSMAQLKKLNPEVEDILEGRKSILPNRRRRRRRK